MINFQNQARICVIVAIFLVLLNNAAMNLSLLFAVFFAFLSQEWRTNFKLVVKNTVIKIAFLLLFFISCATLYSEASWLYAYRVWDKYLKIFYFILFLPLFLDSTWRKRAIIALI